MSRLFILIDFSSMRDGHQYLYSVFLFVWKWRDLRDLRDLSLASSRDLKRIAKVAQLHLFIYMIPVHLSWERKGEGSCSGFNDR